jgi:hypothetical protein
MQKLKRTNAHQHYTKGRKDIYEIIDKIIKDWEGSEAQMFFFVLESFQIKL